MRPFSVFMLAFAAVGLASCQKERTTAPATGLEGTWRLVKRQCYCTPSPVPNETVTFTDTRFIFYLGSRGMRIGTYTQGTAPVPCIANGTPGPALQLTDSNGTTTSGPFSVQYRLDGNTLTLDYGSPCDFPLDTYQRLSR